MNLVVELHFGCLYHGVQRARAAVRGSPFQIGIAALHATCG